ncbi:MAG: ATP-dependent helicase HrpA [uncultured Propionibacteriaceae bacterium]|uniref:ATP-dependent helicase HrpA n=1 Tax=uncultured Propionibacteriaceae bacterium TaxID=257457 RepID=A0A6J4NUD5_9ACTN|nr:MAG: ATP-dependent helicase HrpA [uncultured Propionibacteriaceae bacterium]
MRTTRINRVSSAPTIPESSGLQISYDDQLPISAWRTEIAETIRDHQVVIVAGETGSGKTTQLPKICLELGRRSIGHTQPRRIAARSVAERIAEELKTPLGELVGFQVRFTRKASRNTQLKVMTDGVLLAEIGHDRDLRRYDTIIIDEAHERSLNIDFLLGYLKQLLSRRPELKVIVTSATIDTDRFSAHFAGPDGIGAPIIAVSGRTYPVEIRYRPPVEEGQSDQVDGICAAITELTALGDGDILVFLSGEREIRDAAEAIEAMQLRSTEVLPLYARLSSAEQHRVFAAHPGRRVVLATNVAETSLTVPGIRYVVDTGTARMSRYSARTKVQRLPIEPISQASANQRAGRCGRVAPGICIRLYSEEDYLGRPEFTEPEILRTNLASVILQMTAADLGEIASFPFVEPPDNAQITDGLRLLDELGALSGKGSRGRPRLTGIGRRLAAIPLDPRMGRMLLAGERQGCLAEMLIIVSGLSIQDPRERPAEHREAADALHRRFWAPPKQDTDAEAAPVDGSDFLALLRLWDHIRDSQKSLSGNAFRRMCRDEYLHFLRIREWQDLHAQLREISRELKLNRNTEPAPASRVHTAVLSGLLSHVGLADLRDDEKRGNSKAGGRRRSRPGPREYLGARGTKFAINPGSSVAKIQPPLVMAAEIVETTRLWARTVAGIEASQIEEVGQHLLKRNYSEPHWSSRTGSVMAYEQVNLYGIPIIASRRVSYAKINPVEAREIFLRSALVEGDWRSRHSFVADNAATRAEAEELEERTRRRDVVVDDQVIYDFFDRRIPTDVTSAAAFDHWWKTARQQTPDLLTLTLDDLITPGAAGIDAGAFPDTWVVGDLELPIEYTFDPGSARDGVAVRIDIAVLNQLDPAPFSWQVPGLRTELATELIRSLPKSTRKQFVPAPEYARRALEWLRGANPVAGESLPEGLGRALRALTGELVPADQWRDNPLPSHVEVTFLITGESGVVTEGTDLDVLKTELGASMSRTLSAAAAEHTRTGAVTWVFGTMPGQVELVRDGRRVVGYPALVDEGATVGQVVLDTEQRQRISHRAGLRRLVVLNTPDPTKWVISHLSNIDRLALAHSPYAGVPALLADARLATVGELVTRHATGPVRDQNTFRALCDAVRADQADLMRAVVDLTAEILTLHQQILTQLPSINAVAPASAADITEQLGNLVFPGFLAATAYSHLVDLPRYLRAVQQRLSVLAATPARDASPLETISRCEDAYAELCSQAPPGPLPDFVEEAGWMLEELRVSLFAQGLRTKIPVSEKRVRNAISTAAARL